MVGSLGMAFCGKFGWLGGRIRVIIIRRKGRWSFAGLLRLCGLPVLLFGYLSPAK